MWSFRTFDLNPGRLEVFVSRRTCCTLRILAVAGRFVEVGLRGYPRPVRTPLWSLPLRRYLTTSCVGRSSKRRSTSLQGLSTTLLFFPSPLFVSFSFHRCVTRQHENRELPLGRDLREVGSRILRLHRSGPLGPA